MLLLFLIVGGINMLLWIWERGSMPAAQDIDPRWRPGVARPRKAGPARSIRYC